MTTTTMPTWLRSQLLSTGILSIDGVTRTARARLCRSCGAQLLVGLDADLCAFVARADIGPIDVAAEAQALLAGRRTYTLAWRGRLELDLRDQWSIPAHPPGEVDVLAEHRCGQVLGTGYPRAGPATLPVSAPDEPPF